MAFKAVVTNAFVEQIIAALKKLTVEQGEFTLAMIVPSETGLRDRWNLVLSAKWIDDNGLQAVIPTITASLQKQLSKTNASKIELVSVLPTTHPLVKDLMDLDIAVGTAYEVQATALTTRGLFDVIVFAAQKPRSVANIQRQKIRTRA